MNSKDFQMKFPIGSHICRTPAPDFSEMCRDMELLKKNGFNLIKIQEHWFWDEPREGEYEFSPISDLIAYAADLNLGVYLGLSCEQAPSWIWKKFPDAGMVTRQGVRVPYIAQTAVPGDGKPGPCPDHPGVAEAQKRFITELVTELGKFENIVVWNTWQEIGYWSERLVGGETCFCDHTLNHFRNWLVKKYGNIDQLNTYWRTRYAEFKDIYPNMGQGRFCNSVDIDWKQFIHGEFVQQTLRMRAETIKAADPLKRPVFAHIDMPLNGSGTPWLYSETQDFLGSSSYPTWFSIHDWDDIALHPSASMKADCLQTECWDSILMRFDCVRSANPKDAQVWAAELQGGPVSTGLHLGRVPDAADIRRWFGTLLFAGVTGISYWVTRAEIMAHELNGYSLLDSEGETTERFEEAGRLAEAISRYTDLFNVNNLETAEAAILINEENYALLSTLENSAEEHLGFSTRGWYKLLWEAGITIDFVSLDEANLSVKLARYKMAVLPFPFSLSNTKAKMLSAYVEQGGFLVSEACPGRIDEYGFANRGEMVPEFRALFGISQDTLRMVTEPENGQRYTPYPRGWGEMDSPEEISGTGPMKGVTMLPRLYLQTFTCDSPTAYPVLAVNGKTAGVLSEKGDGKALLIGTYPGYGATAYRKYDNGSFVARLIEMVELNKQEINGVLYRKRGFGGSISQENPRERKGALVLFNPTSEPRKISVPKITQMDDYTVLFGGKMENSDTDSKSNREIIIDALDCSVIVYESGHKVTDVKLGVSGE